MTKQQLLELADELDGIVSALKMGGKGNEVWMANSDAPTIQKAVLALRQAAAAQGREAIIEECAKIADAWIADFGNLPTKHLNARDYAVEAVKDIADAIRAIALTPAVAPDAGVGEADALASVIATLKPTEEADIDFLLDLQKSARTDIERRANIRLFRNQI